MLITKRAQWAGHCDGCDGPFAQNDTIKWDPRTKWTYHPGCAPTGASGKQTAEDREYLAGRAEGNLRSVERDIYGAELVEQWDIEREMNPRNWDF